MGKIHKLTPLMVKNTAKMGWIADGGGLYLRVRNDATKTWVFRYTKNHKTFAHVIGAAHTITLAHARNIAAECRLARLEGKDIRTVLYPDDSGRTFKDAAFAIIERKAKNWKSDKTKAKWENCLYEHATPLHHITVNQITIKDIEDVLKPIWYTNNFTARLTRSMIEQTLDLSTVLGWREGDNPARWKGALEYLLPDHKPKVKHHAAMPYAEAPAFYQGLMKSKYVTRHAFALTILTASRGHMVRFAEWHEFDLKKKLWTIPAVRMKRSDDDHVIPLTPSMLKLLPEISKPKMTGLVFPYHSKSFSENAFRSTLKAYDLDYTSHGFRSTFKDWAMDCTSFADEVSELALAHKVGSSVRRAYRRGKGLTVRRELMRNWCSYLEG